MKKLLAFILVLALCLSLCTGLTACVKKDTGSGTSSTTSDLDAALEYIKTLYKKATEKTTRDFIRIGSVPVNGKNYEVVWSVDVAEEHVKIVKNADGTITIDVNEVSAEDIAYTLTATISDGSKVVSHSWKHLLPKAELDFAAIVDEAYALAAGASMDREVTLTGVINKVDTPYDPEAKYITVTMDVVGVEGKPIQCYRMKGEGAENLKVGDTITVAGTLTNYNGTIEFASGCQLLSVTAGEAVDAPTDVETILKEAYALAEGASTKYEATLTGKITSINTPYNASFKNISVTIEVEGYPEYPILCYRIKGEGADSLLVGDTITVKGYIVNYAGKIEFGEGSALLKVEKTGTKVEAPSDPKQILKDAYALKEDESLPYEATLTGKITKVNEFYSSQFGNITVTIVVEGETDKPVKCYRLVGTGVENEAFGVGDTITVTGYITNYKGEVEFAQGCTLVKWENTNTAATTYKELTIKEAISMGSGMASGEYSSEKYKITGVITNVYNTQYGNMYIKDASGNELLVYGTYSKDGADRYDAMSSKPDAGDTVTLLGVVGNFNGTPQMKNAWILSFEEGEAPKVPSAEEMGIPAEDGSEITIKQAVTAGQMIPQNMFTENKYKVTGKITEIKSTTYGNLYIEDAEGNKLYVYGTYNADGTVRYDALDVKPIVGDTITVLGIIGNYNGAQMKNGWILEHTVPTTQLEVSFSLNYDGAGEAPASFKVNENTAYGTLPTPIREGWKFIGWYLTAECDGDAVTPDMTVTASHTLYAKWEEVEAIDPDVLAAMQAIVDAAYALEKNASLEGTKTLTGQIVEITTAYNESGNKITVVMAVEGRETMAIKCYNMTGTAADVSALAIGDTITVTGTLTNYNYEIEFASGCTLDDVVKGTLDVVTGMTDAEIVDAAYAVEKNRFLPGRYTLTGKLVSIDSAYDASYGNMTVTMAVEGKEDKAIKCFRLKGEGCDVLAVGYTITVTGIIKNYNGTVEFDQGCILVSYEAPGSSENQVEVSFDLNYEGAPAAPNAIQVNEGGVYGTLPTVEREGYTFGGWYTEDTCTNAVDASTVVTATEAHTLYAKWTENSAIPEETMQDIVDAAYALEAGTSMTEAKTLAGKVLVINTPYDAANSRISVTIAVEGREDKPIQCYRLTGEGIDEIAVGDTVTVTGTIKNYSGLIEFDTGCTLDELVKGEAEESDGSVDLFFDYDKANRVSQDANSQVWAQNGITFTNEKGSSTSDVGNYGAPTRLYKSSSVTVAYPSMTKMIVTCDTVAYATALVDSIADDNATVTQTGLYVTIEFAEAVDSFAIASLTAQVRAHGIKIYAAEDTPGGETPEDPVARVFFNLNYIGAAGGPDFITVNVGEAYGDQLPADPTREGYTFGGWYLTAECDGDAVTATTPVSADHTLYAKWTENTSEPEESTKEITIDFSTADQRTDYSTSQQVWANEGVTFTNSKTAASSDVKDNVNPVRLYASSSIRVEGTGLKKIVFVANDASYATALLNSIESSMWTVDSNGTTVIVEAPEPTEFFFVSSLTAQVRLNSITVYVATSSGEIPAPEMFDVTFDLNGAEGTAPTAVQVSENASYGTLPTAEREGYTFGGWYKNAECTGDAVTPDTEVTESHTLYAKWTENSSSEEEAVPTDITIDFTSTTHRESWDSTQQTWKNGGVTLVNTKTSGSSAVVDASNPAKFYKYSILTITCTDMTQITFVGAGDSKYKVAIGDSLTAAGYTATVDGDNYTVIFAEPVDTFEFAMDGGQARMSSMTVTALVAGGSEGGSGSEGEGGEGGSEGEGEGSGTTTPTPTTPAEIVDAAYGLASGATLDGTYTLTGKVTSVKTAYDSYYGNVSVIMTVEGKEDKPILCYRMTGTGADVVAAGYTITVTGSLTNFNGTIEFAQGCTLDSYVEGSLGTENMTPAEIVDAAYALATDAYMAGNYTLTGKITSVDTPYDSGFKNVTVTIAVEGREDKPIMCYRMKGTGADVIAVGDTITVSGILKNHQGTVEFDSGCTLDSYVKDDSTVVPPATGDHIEPADVVYSKGTPSSSNYTNVVKNWGLRGDVATSLSPMATAFYTGENTYANLSAKSGSSDLSSVPKSELYTALQVLMADAHIKQTTYGEVRYLLAYTDCQNIDTSKLSLFYSGDEVTSTWDNGTTYNREHCWPKSHTTQTAVSNDGETGVSTDIMTIRPEAQSNNSSRGNIAYGTSSGYYFPNLNSKYDLRGDCARIVLYTYVRWNQTNLTDAIQSVDVLLNWIQADPVDTWELARNDSVESITGTRNVFVDYPELAFLLFGQSVPSGLVTPAA